MAPRPLFRLLLLLLGSFYLGSVCELDAAECRQHYAQESHEHVLARPGVEVSTPAAQPDEVPALLVGPGIDPAPRSRFCGLPGSPASWPWVANPPPPVRRLYLRYAVLQV